MSRSASLIFVFVFTASSLSLDAHAQPAPPPAPAGSNAPAAPPAAPPAPSAAPASSAAPAPAAPSTAPPAPSPPPPPPPNYGPPPTPYVYPAGGFAPPAAPDRPAAPAYIEQGFYGAVAIGVGGPFGGNTVTPLSEGFGVAGALGYAFHPNFGADFFGHYNTTQATFTDSANKPTSNEGSVTLWGFEARGMVGGEGLVKAWASIGAAFGSGKLALSGPVSGATLNVDNDVDFKAMPVLAFGAEAKVADGFRIGPQVRWYMTGVDGACQNASASNGATSASQSRCATAIDNQTSPDILFIGVTMGYNQH